jgi:hypothetical protein
MPNAVWFGQAGMHIKARRRQTSDMAQNEGSGSVQAVQSVRGGAGKIVVAMV